MTRLTLAALCATVLVHAADPKAFFQAIRATDLAQIRTLAQSPEAREAADGRGMTPLHYAAAFGSDDAFAILVQSGASVNARTEQSVTPLHLATWDPARVKMLLAKGADATVVSKQGRNALMVAANYPAAAESVRLLLPKTPNLNQQDGMGNTALMNATQHGASASARLLLDAGADASIVSKPGFTAVHSATTLDAPARDALLAKKPDVNVASTMAGQVPTGTLALNHLTPLMFAAPYGETATIARLLENGANVNARDIRGMTALMFTAASDNQNLDAARLLIAKGADVNIKSNDGETALDWARKAGNPKMIALLEKHGAKGNPAPASRLEARPAGLGRSVELLQAGSRQFFRKSGCMGCHHQPMAANAVAAARSFGIHVDEAAAAEDAKAIAGLTAQFGPGALQGFDPPGGLDMLNFPLFGLAAAKAQPDLHIDSTVFWIAAHQGPSGGWDVTREISRPPFEESNISATAYAIHSLRSFSWPARQAEFDQRIARAKAWLAQAKPRTSYERADQLMGLKWAGATEAELAPIARALLAAQRTDGGWAQNPWLASDAYATGLAVHALRAAGMSKLDSKAFERGKDYLRRTQLADGSWRVASRTPKFQPYFESGFPHGHDQWISFPATAWAVMALAAND
jgi:ankyrin repeat protein